MVRESRRVAAKSVPVVSGSDTVSEFSDSPKIQQQDNNNIIIIIIQGWGGVLHSLNFASFIQKLGKTVYDSVWHRNHTIQ